MEFSLTLSIKGMGTSRNLVNFVAMKPMNVDLVAQPSYYPLRHSSWNIRADSDRHTPHPLDRLRVHRAASALALSLSCRERDTTSAFLNDSPFHVGEFPLVVQLCHSEAVSGSCSRC